jgi:hypothetical protein
MPIVALILLLIVSTAQAVVPFRLVTEIQLPARTIQWDVQHFEDSTSFGWVAITEGEVIEDEEGEMISPAIDTIWFKANTAHAIGFMPVSRLMFSYGYSSLRWAEPSLLRIDGLDGPALVAKMYHSINMAVRLYFFDLSGDSVLISRTLEIEEFDNYTLRSIDVWPQLPGASQWVLAAGLRNYTNEGSGCDVDTDLAQGLAVALPSYNYTGIGCFSLDLFDRTDSLAFARWGGIGRYIYGCEDVDNYFENNYVLGSIYRDGSFVLSDIAVFESRGKGVEQEDFDGTQRLLHSTGDCYNAESGEVVFNNPAINDSIMSAYIRNAPGEDFLYFQAGRFQVYDGRTGEWVDSTSVIQGIPQYTLVTSGLDQLVTYDATQKLVRVYQSLSTLLTINVTDAGQVQLSWMPSAGAVGYRLDASSNSDFTTVCSDFFDASTTSTIVSPNAPIKFFRVTPLFE